MATVVRPRRVEVRQQKPGDGPLTAEEIAQVRNTFKPVSEIKDEAARLFYNRLFELDPSLRPLFASADMTEQGKKLMSTIAVAVGALDKLGEIVPTVRELGVRHKGYGVEPAHYDTVGKALIDTLKGALGDAFTPDAENAWIKTYGILADTMKAAAAESSGPAGDTSSADNAPGADKEETTVPDSNIASSSAMPTQSFQTMMDAMPVAVMVAEIKNLEIIYMNKLSLDTLRSIEDQLPVKADNMIGTCIDVFHKDPSHQRRMLADARNLPHSAVIQVGTEKLDLLVNPLYDDSGNYFAAVVTWSVVTEKLKTEAEAASLKATLSGISASQALIEFQPDGTIITANENFCKTMGYALDEIKGKHHSMFAPAGVAQTPAYAKFWEDLRANKFATGEFERVGKGGKTVWLQAAYNPVVDETGKVTKVVKNCSDITEAKLASLEADAAQFRQSQMLNQIPVNVMMCDLENFEINYANDTSKNTLKTLEALLPIKAADIVGTSIDVFHKNPSHQRNMLKDPSNLPHKTKIQVGPETLDLLVSPITDAEGNYIGPMLTWNVITRSVKLADDFETNIKGIANAVSSASTEMQSSAEALAATAEETSNQANTVAAASEQLSSSINEISQQVSRSASISAEAVTEAQRSEEQIQGLADAADKIGEVVNLINDIAGQTNLLALNATIEAARAGEAGKGFAVVASEVKSLANQTAKATDEISGQISSIQGATRDAVAAISGISKIINELNEIATAISSAVEEQGAATQEVATNISGVTSAASETGQSASQVLEAAADLSKQSETLGTEADSFLAEMRK